MAKFFDVSFPRCLHTSMHIQEWNMNSAKTSPTLSTTALHIKRATAASPKATKIRKVESDLQC